MEEDGRYCQSPGKVTHLNLCFVSFVDLHVFLPSYTLAAGNGLYQYESNVGNLTDTGASKSFQASCEESMFLPFVWVSLEEE